MPNIQRNQRIKALTPLVVTLGSGIMKSWAWITSVSSVSYSSNLGPFGRYKTARMRDISAIAKLLVY